MKNKNKYLENQFIGKETKLAQNNFKIANRGMPTEFIYALAMVKKACALANMTIETLNRDKCNAICKIADMIIDGKLDNQFPIDIFQTGSGTSTNMNLNEVIAHYAKQELQIYLHPNDDVNKSQSSNDTIPTSIHLSSALIVSNNLLPALNHLVAVIQEKQDRIGYIVKTGRTHLMDAMPISFEQELSGWKEQILDNINRIKNVQPRLHQLAQGGTAVGTGINAPKKFAIEFSKQISKITGLDFTPSNNYFKSMASQDTVVELSGALSTTAISLIKISNDLRWMNSGPINGLAEIELEPLQAGSSIMPGKVNPVIPEAVIMSGSQIIGNHQAIICGGMQGNFQLNVMLPMIADNIIYSLNLASNAAKSIAEKAIKNFIVKEENIKNNISKNPILVTALNTVIGYEKGAEIAKIAFKEKRTIIEVAMEKTNLSEEELTNLLNPEKLI